MLVENCEEVAQLVSQRAWSTPVATIHNIYVGDMTNGIEEHLESIELIRSASSNDVVNIYVTSCGGAVDIAENYREAMLESQAHVVTIAIGGVSSAGTTVFLSGHERIVKDSALFMFHNVQFGSYGDMVNVGIQAEFYRRAHTQRFSEIYSEILTPEELSGIFDHAKEVYLTAEEMRNRLAKTTVCHTARESSTSTPVADSGTKFKVTLEDGYEKVFDLATLQPNDFNEYTYDELAEIAKAFNVELGMSSFDEDKALLTAHIRRGHSVPESDNNM